VALMAVIDALSSNNSGVPRVSAWPMHQVVFAAFDAESYGYLGSKQFVKELILNQSAFKNLSLDKLSHIIEAKQVGSMQATSLFIHSKHSNFANTMNNLKAQLGVAVEIANSTGPGMPPSSLTSFASLRPTRLIESLVLTDHFSNYSNRYFDSVFDDYRNVNSELVCAAATLIFRTLVKIGSPSTDAISLKVNCSLVVEMLNCLSRNVSCSEARDLLPKFDGPVPDSPSHYPSVFVASRFTLHQRFVHDWISDRSAVAVGGVCDVNKPNCVEGEICLRGRCKRSYTRYVDATSANVKLVVGDIFAYFQILDEQSADPLWTEADWTPIGFRTFSLTNPVYDFAFAALAVLVACGTIAVSIVLNAKFTSWFRVVRT